MVGRLILRGLLAGLALFVALVAAAMWLMPAVDEVPEHFSAVLLWRFRLVSLGMQALIWTVIGLGFGVLAERVLKPVARVGVPVRVAPVR